MIIIKEAPKGMKIEFEVNELEVRYCDSVKKKVVQDVLFISIYVPEGYDEPKEDGECYAVLFPDGIGWLRTGEIFKVFIEKVGE